MSLRQQMYSYVIYGFYYGKLESLDFLGFGSSVMWHFVTGFVLHSISEAVQSFETLGSVNTLTCHHVTEDLSQKSECETLKIIVQCVAYTLRAELSHNIPYHTHIWDIFSSICGCCSLINGLSFVLNIVHESQEVPVCGCVWVACLSMCYGLHSPPLSPPRFSQ